MNWVSRYLFPCLSMLILSTSVSFANTDETLKHLQEQINKLKLKTGQFIDSEEALKLKTEKLARLDTIRNTQNSFIRQQQDNLKKHKEENLKECKELSERCLKLENKDQTLEVGLKETKELISNHLTAYSSQIDLYNSTISTIQKQLDSLETSLKNERDRTTKLEETLVYSRYTTSEPQSVTIDSTYRPLNFENKIHDTHNAVELANKDSGKNWEFKAPSDGLYYVYAQVHYAGISVLGGDIREWALHILRNGKVVATGTDFSFRREEVQAAAVHVFSTFYLKKGETVAISGSSNINETVKTHSSPLRNYVEIVRLGNSPKPDLK